MIPPLKAVASKTMMSNPYALNPQKAYSDTKNYAFMGSKLNINVNDARIVHDNKTGQNLDVMA